MALLQRFDPPAFLSDYDGIPGLREAWHAFISRCFELSIASEAGRVKRADNTPGIVQFYSSAAYDPGGPVIEQAIVWNAFPKELLRRYGRERTLVEADKLWPLRRYSGDPRPGSPAFEAAVYRPLDEYCEWHVVRDPDTNKIVRVTFTSEPPEYWGGCSAPWPIPPMERPSRSRVATAFRRPSCRPSSLNPYHPFLTRR